MANDKLADLSRDQILADLLDYLEVTSQINEMLDLDSQNGLNIAKLLSKVPQIIQNLRQQSESENGLKIGEVQTRINERYGEIVQQRRTERVLRRIG